MRESPTPSGDNVGYGLGTDAKGEPVPVLEYEAATAVKNLLDTLPGMAWDKKAAVAMVAAILIIGEEPSLKGRRGSVINAMTAEFRRRCQAYLPL